MPGFNKKGPQNKGPKSGCKRGLCVSDDVEPEGLNIGLEEMSVGRGQGSGRGQGRRFGRDGKSGRGFGRNTGIRVTGQCGRIND